MSLDRTPAARFSWQTLLGIGGPCLSVASWLASLFSRLSNLMSRVGRQWFCLLFPKEK